MRILRRLSIADFVTFSNALVGFLAIMYLIDNKIYYAYPLLLIATILDALDGMVARYFGTKHNLGRHLDSIADMVSFCFAPAILLYVKYYDITRTSFDCLLNALTVVTCFLIVGFGILRLARFVEKDYELKHFLGLPTPANALLIIILTVSPVFEIPPLIVLAIVITAAVIMISEIKYPKIHGKLAAIAAIPIVLIIFSFMLPKVLVMVIWYVGLVLIFAYVIVSPLIMHNKK